MVQDSKAIKECTVKNMSPFPSCSQSSSSFLKWQLLFIGFVGIYIYIYKPRTLPTSFIPVPKGEEKKKT